MSDIIVNLLADLFLLITYIAFIQGLNKQLGLFVFP